MNTNHAKSVASWLLLASMTAFFTGATFCLVTGVIHARIEGLMVGGTLMLGAVLCGWMRVMLHYAVERSYSGQLRNRTTVMMNDGVRA